MSVRNATAREAVAGVSAGCVTTLVMHPLDLIKVRLQVDRRPHGFGTIGRLVREVVNGPGTRVSNLYRGLGPNLVGNTVSWGVYFALYQRCVEQFTPVGGQPAPSTFLYGSLAAGTLTSLVTNPIWVLKTRMLSTSAHEPGAYRTMHEGLGRILREEGLLALWKGFTPSLFGIGQTAVQFALYDSFKSHRLAQQALASDSETASRTLPTSDYIGLSAASKIIAASLAYPYQVVRARLQIHGSSRLYTSPMDVVAKVYAHEGLAGFYKGLAANLLRVVPSTCITLVVYESTKNSLA